MNRRGIDSVTVPAPEARTVTIAVRSLGGASSGGTESN